MLMDWQVYISPATWNTNTKIVVLVDRNLKSEFHPLIITEFVLNRKRLWENLNGCEQWFPIFLSSALHSDLVQGAAARVHRVLRRARHNFWLLMFTKSFIERLVSGLGWAVQLCIEPPEFTLGCDESNPQALGNNVIPWRSVHLH